MSGGFGNGVVYLRYFAGLMSIRYSKPPVLLHDVIGDLGAVVDLLTSQEPYHPLGGWYSLGADPHARTRPTWFQKDWVHDTFAAEGSELFLWHPTYVDAAKAFYDAAVVEPKSVYVNLMTSMAEAGPAHTDNPRFHGRDRTNTPMWLLRVMLWSGLFDDVEIMQATAIWWMNDVEGGGLLYWPMGPDRPPEQHVGSMANTALFGDNHGMFHQVGPVGPFERGTLRVTPRAELAPARDGTADWTVVDQGEQVVRTPLDSIRVSVLWKADVYRTAAERDARVANALSMHDVAEAFNNDLARRGSSLRLDPAQVDEPSLKDRFADVYPEVEPVGALPSVFDDQAR
ncbi:MAG: hypothetical protein FJW86_01200 [Actinobacteria bacterium]|nr:hypothetical protein [Actinomycetota bacterium]